MPGSAAPLSGTRPQPIIVTTSWDDGDIRDRRVGEMLLGRGMRGTFYCPVEAYLGRPALSKGDMRRMIDEGLEIGGHGIAHEIMTETAPDKMDGIVAGAKAFLEDAVGREVPMYCYPRGRYTRDAMHALRRAGYKGARTVRLFDTGTHHDLFELPTTMQACPHTRVQYFRNILRGQSAPRLLDYAVRLRTSADWLSMGKTFFDRVIAQGGVWHLWGHSWELDDLNLWTPLAEMLDYVAGRPGVLYLTNGQMVEHLAARRAQGRRASA
jgi:peptidoglycan/xylan/chitin deacetylase (PgdA/CDA1 family)